MSRVRRLIIDAYNVLHVTGVLAPERAGPDLAELVALIGLSRWRDLQVKLVCDGAAVAGLGLSSRVEAVFAGPGQDADTLIETMLEQNSAPRSLRVISSDRRLRMAARRRRAGWMSSEEFLRFLNMDAGRRSNAAVKPIRPESAPTAAGVEDWLKRFGVLPDDPLRRLQSAAGSLGPSSRGSQRRPPDRDGADSIPHIEQDPIVEEALQEWRNRLNPDDLDMSQWITGVEPL